MLEQLIVAIYHKNIDEVTRLLEIADPEVLKSYYTPKSVNEDRKVTPLQFAAGTPNNAAIIKLLLAKGADPKATTAFGRTALSVAARFGLLENCEVLMGVSDLLSKDEIGLTAYGNSRRGFNSAKTDDCKNGCKAVEKLLGFETFQAAFHRNDSTLMKKILDNDPKGIYTQCCERNCPVLIAGLVKDKLIDLNAVYQGEDALRLETFIAAFRSDTLPLARKLRAEGIDMAKVFVRSCERNDIEVVKKLLRHKLVDINAVYHGETGLHCACFYAHSELVRYLLSFHQLDVNAVTTSEHPTPGLTPLHRAVRSDVIQLDKPAAEPGDDQAIRVDIAEMLINHGASLDSKDSSDVTPLHSAIAHNKLELVKLLVMRGTDLTMIITIDDPELIQKYLPGRTTPLQENFLDFSISRPEIYDFLKQVMNGEYVFSPMETIAHKSRYNYEHPQIRELGIQPKRFYENASEHEEALSTIDQLYA